MPKSEPPQSSLPRIKPRDLDRFGSSSPEGVFIIRAEDMDQPEPRRRPLAEVAEEQRARRSKL